MARAAHVLIGGGAGFIGRHLVSTLRADGVKVQIISRKSKGPDYISWNEIEKNGLPKNVTSVVNLAGRNILEPKPWTSSYKTDVYKSRILTNKTLVKAIYSSKVKPESFICISGVGYYPSEEEYEYDENWTLPPGRAENFLVDLARDWEQSSLLREEFAPSTRNVVIRSGIVIGSDGGIIQTTKFPFSLGLGGPIGDGRQWFPWIHVDDLANMFKFAILNKHVTDVINGVAPEQVRNQDYANALGHALKRPAIFTVPGFVVKLLFGNDRSYMLLTGPRVRSKAELLGFRYLYPTLREACAQSLS